jgi:hypothetical protein
MAAFVAASYTFCTPVFATQRENQQGIHTLLHYCGRFSMNTLRRWIILIGLLSSLMLARGTQAATFQNVQPPIAPPGTQFLFFASGFTGNEPISIWVNTPDGRVLAATPQLPPLAATSYGEATWSWISPDDAPLGVWQMVAHGRESGFEQVISFTLGTPAASGDVGEGLNVTPTAGGPGTLFRFFVTGFNAGEGFDVAVSGPAGPLESPVLLTSHVASDAGRIDGSWSAPDGAAAGTWYIGVKGAESGVVRTIAVRIDVPAANQPTIIIQPDLGVPGARFVVSANGFRANELISVWLNAPDGRVLSATLEGNAQAGPDGHAVWHWIAPSDAPLGAWQMVAHGRESGIELVVNFTLE